MSSLRPGLGKNAERDFRVRENKRRHRVRHKEYVLDLERRLAKAHEEGIRATKEVQLAAQRVTVENARLKSFLKKIGYADYTIDSIVNEDGCWDSSKRRQLALESMSERVAQNLASGLTQREKTKDRSISANEADSQMRAPAGGRCSPLSKCTSGPVEWNTSRAEISPKKVCSGTKCPSSDHRDPVRPPCQLVTLLAENPAADITQVTFPAPLAKQSGGTRMLEESGSDGIECHTAYKMLIRHATSDEKMDRIAAALESGCVPSTKGGCNVQKSVLWKVLDEECT